MAKNKNHHLFKRKDVKFENMGLEEAEERIIEIGDRLKRQMY